MSSVEEHTPGLIRLPDEVDSETDVKTAISKIEAELQDEKSPE